ncbi:MAG: DDE-type integrase/transposase/recombinase, partial [Sphingomonadaceae bacterium]
RTRNCKDARRFFKRAMKRNGLPTQITIDGSQANLDGARKAHCEVRMKTDPRIDPFVVRQSKYMNNRIEQDHRRVKRRIRLMLGFKSDRSASIILYGIELIHMIRKGQMVTANDAQNLSLADQFDSLAA